MKHSIFLPIPTNADHVPIEKALSSLSERSGDRLTFVFADGLGYTESYNGYMLLIADSFFDTFCSISTQVDENSWIKIEKYGNGEITAVYENDTLPKIDEIEPSIYRRGTLN